jgi:hypothetical protein
VPAVRPNGLQILQAAVPTIEGNEARMKAALLSGHEHDTEVDVLGHTIDRLVVEAIVAWDGVCAITPQQRDQVDAHDDMMVFAGPVTMDQFNVLSIGFVERGVIDNQETSMEHDMLLCLVPKR